MRAAREDSADEMCRVCREGEEVAPLYHPCKCTGSIRWVHGTIQLPLPASPIPAPREQTPPLSSCSVFPCTSPPRGNPSRGCWRVFGERSIKSLQCIMRTLLNTNSGPNESSGVRTRTSHLWIRFSVVYG